MPAKFLLLAFFSLVSLSIYAQDFSIPNIECDSVWFNQEHAPEGLKKLNFKLHIKEGQVSLAQYSGEELIDAIELEPFEQDEQTVSFISVESSRFTLYMDRELNKIYEFEPELLLIIDHNDEEVPVGDYWYQFRCKMI